MSYMPTDTIINDILSILKVTGTNLEAVQLISPILSC
jgi:hypothetical protein